jgi:hypothetical protein
MVDAEKSSMRQRYVEGAFDARAAAGERQARLNKGRDKK